MMIEWLLVVGYIIDGFIHRILIRVIRNLEIEIIDFMIIIGIIGIIRFIRLDPISSIGLQPIRAIGLQPISSIDLEPIFIIIEILLLTIIIILQLIVIINFIPLLVILLSPILEIINIPINFIKFLLKNYNFMFLQRKMECLKPSIYYKIMKDVQSLLANFPFIILILIIILGMVAVIRYPFNILIVRL